MKAPNKTGRVSRRLAVLALGMAASACTNATPLALNDPQAGNDTVARVERLLSYCQRMSESGDYLLARGMCLRAHNLDTSDPRPLMRLADVLNHLERPDAAIEAYKKVLQNQPQNVEALYHLGKAYMQLEEFELALSALDAALHLAPNDSRLHNAVAVMSDRQGEHAKAQEHYRMALVLDPNNLAISSNFGLSLALSGKSSEAVAVLSRVVAAPGASRVSYNNLQVAYQAIERTQSSQDLAQQKPPHQEPAPDQTARRQAVQIPGIDEKAAQESTAQNQVAQNQVARIPTARNRTAERQTVKLDTSTALLRPALAPLELPPYMADVAILAQLDSGADLAAKATAARANAAPLPTRKPQPMPDLPGPLSDTVATQPPIPLLGPQQLRRKPIVKAAGTG